MTPELLIIAAIALAVLTLGFSAVSGFRAMRGSRLDVQRRLLAFAHDCGREAEGVALARELAMITYRTPEEFALRFGPTPPRAAVRPINLDRRAIASGRRCWRLP